MAQPFRPIQPNLHVKPTLDGMGRLISHSPFGLVRRTTMMDWDDGDVDWGTDDQYTDAGEYDYWFDEEGNMYDNQGNMFFTDGNGDQWAIGADGSYYDAEGNNYFTDSNGDDWVLYADGTYEDLEGNQYIFDGEQMWTHRVDDTWDDEAGNHYDAQGNLIEPGHQAGSGPTSGTSPKPKQPSAQTGAGQKPPSGGGSGSQPKPPTSSNPKPTIPKPPSTMPNGVKLPNGTTTQNVTGSSGVSMNTLLPVIAIGAALLLGH
jgi:hypothetical protein